ncbi:MAG: glycosyltransferase family 39 protein [Gemmatimonadaceae bacterium]
MIVVALFLLGIALRVARFLQNRPLWVDEAKLALAIGRSDAVGLMHSLDYNQVAPILYLWVVKAATILFGMHEWTLRLPSLVAGIAMLWVMWLLSRRLLSDVGALLCVALAATAPLLVAYSAEAKPYELDACVTAILLLLALPLFNHDDARRRVALGIAGSAAIGFSLPAVFTLGGIGCALLVFAWRHRNLRAALVTCGFGIIWVIVLLIQRRLLSSDVTTAPNMESFWRDVMIRFGEPGWAARFFFSVRSAVVASMDPVLRFVDILAPAVAVVGTLAIWKRRNPEIALMLVLPLGFALVASGVSLWPIDGRLALFLAPVAFLWFGAAADFFWRAAGKNNAIKVALVGFMILPLAFNLRHPSIFPPREASRELIATLTPRRAMAPVYIVPAGVATWLFYTTDWNHPDRARLGWYERHDDARHRSSRGHPVSEGESAYEWRDMKGLEMVGRFTGMRFVMGRGWLAPGPNPNWGYAEMRRLAATGSTIGWVYGSHVPGAQVDSLRDGVRRNGGTILDAEQRESGLLWQVTFAQRSQKNPATPSLRSDAK